MTDTEKRQLRAEAQAYRQHERPLRQLRLGDDGHALDATCRECKGSGRYSHTYACDTCHGTGLVPTPVGKAILELVRRYGK